jgi:hypothetical protein
MDDFQNIKRFHFYLPSEHSPLSFNAKLVYSYLVYRYRKTFPSTAARIAGETGLDRRKTVPKALEELSSHTLAYKKPDGWRARQPEGKATGWFQWRADAPGRKMFYDAIRYQIYPIPGPNCPLTPRQVYLYGLVVSLLSQNKRIIADKYLQKLSGFDLATVRSGRRMLFEYGLLVDAVGGWQTAPADRKAGWFVPINQAEESGHASGTEPVENVRLMNSSPLPKSDLVKRKLEPYCHNPGSTPAMILREFTPDVIEAFIDRNLGLQVKFTLKELSEQMTAIVSEQTLAIAKCLLPQCSPAIPKVVDNSMLADDFLALLDAEEQRSHEQLPQRTYVEIHEDRADTLIPAGFADDVDYRTTAEDDRQMTQPALVAASVWSLEEKEDQDTNEEVSED